MKQLFSLSQSLISFLESQLLSYPLFCGAFVSILLARILLENWLFGFKTNTALLFWYELSHITLFFLFAFLCFLLVMRFLASGTVRQHASFLVFGFLVILLPPIIDFLLSGGSGFWSFYIFDSFSHLLFRYSTFFGDRPDFGVTYGVRVEVALATLAIAFFVFVRTRHFLRTLLATILVYTVLFLLGTFPSWVAFLVVGTSKGVLGVGNLDIAALFLSPTHIFFQSSPGLQLALSLKMSLVYASLLPFLVALVLFVFWKSIFVALFRNARMPQIVYHGGLLLLGFGLGFLFSGGWPTFSFFEVLSLWVTLAAVLLAWLASVVVNDFFDEATDCETNVWRPLPSGSIPRELYAAIGVSLFVASLFLAAVASFKIAFFLLGYQAIAWLYSAPPFRFKRFPLIATATSAIASLIVLFAGFSLVSRPEDMARFPLSFTILLFLSYTVALPLKDFKDISGDRKMRVWTIPVLFGASRAKLFIGALIFLDYMASVFLFKSSALVVPGALFGSISFWLIASLRERKGLVTYYNIFWWMLALVVLYGLYVVRVVL